MAEGFLGGLLGGIGDAAQGVGSGLAGLLGGGQSGGPSSSGFTPDEERRMMISTLGQLGATLLAAGQKQSPSQRAQYLSQLGGIGSGAQNDIYKARQGALMSAQMQEKMREMEQSKLDRDELLAIDARRKSDPAGFARELGVPESLVKISNARDLREISKQIIIKRATVEPGQAALTDAFLRQAGGVQQPAPPVQGMPPAAAPMVAQPSAEMPPAVASMVAPTAPEITAPSAGSSIYSSAAIPAGTSPQDSQTIRAYQSALNDPRVARDPKLVKDITETLDRLLPGVREASISRVKRQEELVANKPKALIGVETSDMQTNIVTGIVDDALKSLKEGGRYVAGPIGSRLEGITEGATNLAGQINAIKAAIGASKIQEMKAQSQTGATGYGALAVRELDRIEATLGTINQNQSPEEIEKRLNTIKSALQKYNENIQLNYKSLYGEEYKRRPQEGAPADGAPVKVTQEEYSKLKPGTLFIDPNGQVRRKPNG